MFGASDIVAVIRPIGGWFPVTSGTGTDAESVRRGDAEADHAAERLLDRLLRGPGHVGLVELPSPFAERRRRAAEHRPVTGRGYLRTTPPR